MTTDPAASTPLVSVIVPTCNEAERLPATLAAARAPGVEVIVVDGGSTDATVTIAECAGVRVLRTTKGRGRQLATGAAAARGETLLFLHADARLPAGYASTVIDALADPRVALGAFRLGIDAPGLRFRCVESFVRLRCALCRMPYGDQALFVRTTTYRELGGFVELPAMEDFDFVRRAKRRGRIALLAARVLTSPRSWRRHGVLRLSAINLGCAIACLVGVPLPRVAAWRVRHGLAAATGVAITSGSASSRTA